MATNIIKEKKNNVKIINEIRNGVSLDIIEIDGIKAGVLGSNNAEDKELAIEKLQTIVNTSDKHGVELILEVQQKLYTAALYQENGVPEDEEPEEIEIDNKVYLLFYKNKKIVDLITGETIAELDKGIDIKLDENGKKILKEILVNKIKVANLHE